jgi:drug/metabolite transporter (DMT)-like permease
MAVAVEMLGGGTILLLASVITRENLAAVPSAGSIAALLYLTTFGSLIAFTAYMFLLRKVRPALATSYAYVNPVVAVALGVLLANESISPLGILAMIVILSGVGLLAAGRGKQAAQKAAGS